MNALDQELPDDDELAALLVDFETQLATGGHTAALSEGPATTGDERLRRLEDAKECLLLLEEVWPHARPFDDEPPRAIGRFQILGNLGHGGFGIVYLAYDARLGREVALKVQRPEAITSALLRQRFLREAKAAARLEHPHIAGVHEVGDSGLQVWIASEFVAGGSLAAWLRANPAPVSPRDAARFMVSLAEALEYAHQHGVLHRDLKPSNVLVQGSTGAASESSSLSSLTPKVIDFGLARLDEGSAAETRTGMLIGTPPYMAPEQALGQVRQIAAATDVYGLGTILYELLTGKPAFRGESDVQTLRFVIEDDPEPPRKVRAVVPVDLESICLKCLEKSPAKRYATAGALASDLQDFLAGRPTVARPLNSMTRLLKWTRRRPALASLYGVSAAALVALVLITSLYVVQLRAANETTARALAEAQRSAEKSQRQEQAANQLSYASQMRVAYQAIDQGEIEQVAETLDRYRPSDDPAADLRGFEWYHLKQRMHNERLTLSGHKGEVYAVMFTPDGRQIVSGGQDGTLRFWDAESGSEMRTIAAHESCVNAMSYSPDGTVLATGSCDRTIKLWDASTLKLLDTLEGHEMEILCLAFCPTDGNRLAAAGSRKPTRIWNLKTRRIERTFDTTLEAGMLSYVDPANPLGGFAEINLLGDIQALAWRADGAALAIAGGAAPRSHIWYPEDEYVELRDFGSDTVATSARGDICWGRLRSATHESPDLGVQPVSLSCEQGRVQAVACSPRGDRLATAGSDRVIRIWDADKNVCLQVLAGHSKRIQSLAFSPRGGALASASYDGTVKVWNEPPRDQAEWSGKFLAVNDQVHNQVAISSDFRFLALVTGPEELSVYRLNDGLLLGTLPIQDTHPRLRFLPGRPVLWRITRAPGDVQEWDVETWKSRRTYAIPPGRRYEYEPVGNLLVVDRGNETVIESASTGKIGDSFPMPDSTLETRSAKAASASELVLSPGGTTLVSDRARDGQRGWILEARDEHSPGAVKKTELPVTSGYLMAASEGAAISVRRAGIFSVGLFDTRSGRLLLTLRHPDSVGVAAFSPDGKTLAVASGDHTVVLWNVASGQEIVRLATRSSELFRLQFSSDGRRLAVVGRVDAKNLDAIHDFPNGHRVTHMVESTAFVTIWQGVAED